MSVVTFTISLYILRCCSK